MNKTLLYSRTRAKALYRLDKYVDKIGMYTSYKLEENETIGSTNEELERVIQRVKQIGYNYNSLSAAKQHAETGQIESASFRRIPDQHPELNQLDYTPEIIENWRANESQYHIHLFVVDDAVEITSHYELRPDIFKPSFSKERLQTHYRPDWNETYLTGVAEPEIQRILSQ